MFYRIGLDVHPPMYYIFLKFWHYIFGDSLLSLRGMSIFFGTASIWAGYAFVKEAFKNERAALWAALLIAVNPFQLQYVTEARMYTMGAFFALLAAYFLVKTLNQEKNLHSDESLNMPNLPQDIRFKRSVLTNYLGFTLCMVVIIYTHYYLFFTAAALGFYGLIFAVYHYRKNYKRYVPLLSSFIVIAVSFLPWLRTFLFQYRQVGAGYWIPPINAWSIPATLWDMLLAFGRDTSKGSTRILLAIITLFSIYLFYRFLKKTESFHRWLVALAVIAPFGGAILFAVLARLKGSSSSVYMDRYFLFASMFYSIALAVWFKEIKVKKLAVSLFTAYALVNLFAFYQYWGGLDITARPGMAAAAKFIGTNAEPATHHIFVGTSYEYFNYEYYEQTYFPTPEKPLLYTGGRADISQISHVEGVALLANTNLVPNFAQAVKPGDTVWLLWTNGFGSSKPEVPGNWVQVDEKGFADVRPWVGTWIVVTEYKVN
ncbi:MAG: glycosyltransferase family 39 protein [Patescibacteria group bacterium]|nr:glycosyltransferase family 39 protein [Patescibacteria group bacterium]